MPSLEEFELPEGVEEFAPRPRRRKHNAMDEELAARADALLAAGVLSPDRPLAAYVTPRPAPRRKSAGLRSRGERRPVEAVEAAPVVVPEPVVIRGRTLRQQLASANHRLRYWTRRAAELEQALVQAGVHVPASHCRPPRKGA